MLRLLGVLALFTSCISGFSQNGMVDSIPFSEMRTELAEVREISLKNLDSAFVALDNLRERFEIVGDPNLMAEFHLLRAWMLLGSERHNEILDVLKPVLWDNKQISKSNLANAYLYLGHTYKVEWIADSAIVNYIKALKLYEEDENDRGLSLSYLALGLTYSKLKNEEMSQRFYDKSIEFSTNSKIIEKHKEFFNEKKDTPINRNKTIEMSLDIAQIAKEQGNDRLLMVTYSDLRMNYFEIKDYAKALEYADLELQMRAETSADALVPDTYAFMADIYRLQNKPKDAISKYQEALATATDSLKLDIYKELKDLFISEGNSDEALIQLSNYVELNDSIHQRNVEASIAEVTAKYQTELQEEKIKNLSFENALSESKIEKQQLTIISTVVAAVVIFFLGFLGYKNYKSKQELENAQLNFKFLQTQMNPHFMFNALNEISASLRSAKSNESSKYLQAYSVLMRFILEGSTSDFVSIGDDITLISKFLELQQLVHNHEFSFEVNISDELDLHYVLIPPMLTQPYVENAILHGVKGISSGHIKVSYRAKNEQVLIEIDDNGHGIQNHDDASGNALHTSMGTNITRDRIETYRKLHKFVINSETTSELEKGTLVRLSFPLKVKTY